MKNYEKINRLTNEMVILADMLETVVTDMQSELNNLSMYRYSVKPMTKSILHNATTLREMLTTAYAKDMEAQASFGEKTDILLKFLEEKINELDKQQM